MSTAPETRAKRSLFTLIGDIPGLITALVRGEIESLKEELLGKLKLAGVGIGLIAAGLTFAFFALLLLLTAAVLGLATVLPGWASALIIGAIVLLVAATLALVGVASLKKGSPPTPTSTLKSIQKDVDTIKGTERKAVV